MSALMVAPAQHMTAISYYYLFTAMKYLYKGEPVE